MATLSFNLFFLVVFLSYLNLTILADYNSILQTLQSFEREMFMFEPEKDNVLSNIFLDISDYGCWCNFKNSKPNRILSNAPVLDDFDEICYDLVQGYNCARIEGSSSSSLRSPKETCNPETVTYTSGLNIEDIYMIGMFGDPVDLMKYNCKRSNFDNDCAIKTCIIEGNFILKVFTIWNDFNYKVVGNQGLVQERLKHEAGFEKDLYCQNVKHLEKSFLFGSINELADKDSNNDNLETFPIERKFDLLNEKDQKVISNFEMRAFINEVEEPNYFCCGDYPKVQPFRQDTTMNRSCCGNKSYNVMTSMCCENGEVKIVCD